MEKPDKKAVILKINEEITKTTKSILDLEELTKPISPENAIGRISRMDAINNKSVNEASLRQAREKLAKLKRAIDRIDDDSFGICVQCNQSIPIGRIMLVPQAIKCVNCA
jgi:DnaK suppressor protein